MGGLVGDFVEWAVRKTAETVFDIGGASGNNGGSPAAHWPPSPGSPTRADPSHAG